METSNQSSNKLSRYVTMKRSQPFFVTFVQSLLSFIRLAKLVKGKLAIENRKNGHKVKNPLKHELDKVESVLVSAKLGRLKFSPDNKNKIETNKNHSFNVNYIDLTNNINNTTISIVSKDIKQKVDDHIKKYEEGRLIGRKNIAVNILRNIINDLNHKNTNSNANDNKKRNNLIARKNSKSSITSGFITDIVNKNYILTNTITNDQQDNQYQIKRKIDFKVTEYVPGTTIYFGASLAFKANHGGYLSYLYPNNIRASAHKILTTTRLQVLNADDLSDMSTMKYGDAIWLLAGDYSVLGAYYSTSNVNINKSRTIHPGLISCRRSNAQKAQQYGRWIILNFDCPVDDIGKPVKHMDRILLEQEWYYLASNSPSDSLMYKMDTNLDDLIKSSSNCPDLFSPGLICNWTITLIDTKFDRVGVDRRHQMVLSKASHQLEESKSNRWKKNHSSNINKTNESFKSLDNNNGKFTLNPSSNLYDKYIKKSNEHFIPKVQSLDMISKIYGNESNITKSKEKLLKLRNEYTCKDDDININDTQIKSTLDIKNENYWKIATNVLKKTEEIAKDPNEYMAYRDIDIKVKVYATRMLQRAIRKFLKTKQSYTNMMKLSDKVVYRDIETEDWETVKTKTTLNYSKVAKNIISKGDFNNISSPYNKKSKSTPRLTDSLQRRDSSLLSPLKRGLPVPKDKQLISEELKNLDTYENLLYPSMKSPYFPSLGSGFSRLKLKLDSPVISARSASPTQSLSPTTNSSRINYAHQSNKFSYNILPNEDNNTINNSNLFNNHYYNINRPNTATFISQNSKEEIIQKLGKTNDFDYGLPDEVFDGHHKNISLITGMKFLRVMSNNPSIYDDIKFKKRAKKKI